MLTEEVLRRNLVRETIRLLAGARSAGLYRPGQSPVHDLAFCDLCSGRSPVGRLLVSAEAVGVSEEDARPVRWQVEDERDGLYWVCLACDQLLCRDPAGLMRRVLEAHAAGRNRRRW
jgi:hypothetical protein